MTMSHTDNVLGRLITVVTLTINLCMAVVNAAAETRLIGVRVDGDANQSQQMLSKLQQRASRVGYTIVEQPSDYALRILVLAREPQWQQVFGVSASGAVAVLGQDGELLFMHLRQKESSVGRAIDRMAEQIVDRLPALVRGERVP
jgi:hypothetical protein